MQAQKSDDPNKDNSFDSYIEFLKSKGLEHHPGLYPAFFHLKNGLPYCGLKTNEKINKNATLIRIPISILLTSWTAYNDPQLKQVFCEDFFASVKRDRQDRILIVYLLYLLKYRPESIWARMASLFSKEIDLISFWDHEQIQTFKDPTIRIAVQLQRQNFSKEIEGFQKLRKRLKLFDDEKVFNSENYKWIYIHAVSRCFGTFLKSVYFVPFCEFLNHSCVDSSYECQEKQPRKVLNQSFNEKKRKQADLESCSTSSANSEEYIEDGDFDYASIPSYEIKWGSKVCFNLKEKQVKIVDKKVNELFEWIDIKLDWRRGSTILFICQIIQKIKIVQNQFVAGRKKFFMAADQLENIDNELKLYLKEAISYFQRNNQNYVIKKPKSKDVRQSDNIEETQENLEPPPEKYVNFVMDSREQEYQKGDQVYFRYGKLSNRSLLMRYGFSLQNNIYDHVWVKVSLAGHIGAYPDTMNKFFVKGLPITYKMKIKYSRICSELILWFKSCQWKLTHHKSQNLFYITDIAQQIVALDKAKGVCEDNLTIYGEQMQCLTDKQIGYHQYFKRVYQNSKRKILIQQISLINQSKSILTEAEKKLEASSLREDVKDWVKQQSKKRNLRGYLSGISGLLK